MASTASDADDMISGINVTPLVDVTLVLLIIFMVTAKLIASQAIPLDIPRAKTPGTVQQTFLVSIDASGKIFANGQSVADDAVLRGLAREALGRDKELRTVIRASASATHGAVLHVLDELRDVGMTRVAFAAVPKEKTP